MNRSQFRTILWLRWRLTRNRIRRLGTVNAVVTWVVLSAGCLAALAGGIGGILVGRFALAEAQPLVLLGVWDLAVFIYGLIWLTSLLIEVQRSESIDLTKLLHLPVSLREVFVLNYFVSLLTPSTILTMPAMTGLAIGLTLGRGFGLLPLLPLVLGFFFMVTAWTYCLRGWLSTLVANPRRRRTIIVALTMAVVLVGQAPNLLLNSAWARGKIFAEIKQAKEPAPPRPPAGTGSAPTPSPTPSKPVHTRPTALPRRGRSLTPEAVVFLRRLHAWAPPGWLGLGAMTLSEGRFRPALFGTAGTLALGLFGLGWAYHVTLRYYTGAEKRTRRRPAVPTPSSRSAGTMVTWSVPGLPDAVAALALATLRSLSRAPEVRMMLMMPLLFLLLFGSMFLAQSQKVSTGLVSALAMPGAMLFLLFGLAQMLSNQFGFDRDGFRVLVLLPTRRDHVLLAKNLAFAPIVIGLGFPALLVLALLLHLPITTLLAGWAQFLAGFVHALLIGSLFSILSPYRFSPGSLKPTKMTATVVLLGLVCQVLMMLSFTPLLIPGAIEWFFSKQGWLVGWPINLGMSALLLATSALIYRLALPSLGRLLEQREQRILELVTQEIE